MKLALPMTALIAGLAGGALAVPRPACAAESSIACGKASEKGWASIAPEFEGHWTMKHMAGVAMFGPSPMPFGADQAKDIVLKFENGVLLATSDGWPQSLALRIAHEPHWVTDLPVKLQGPGFVSADEFAYTESCSQMDLPRLIGEATVPVEGMALHFTYRFMIGDENNIYGFMHAHAVFNGVPVTVNRYVLISR